MKKFKFDETREIPMQEGEFIEVSREFDGTYAHILQSVQDWPDAPAGSSGLRLIEYSFAIQTVWMLAERAAREGGIYGFLLEFKQYLGDDPLTEAEFGKLASRVKGVADLSELLHGKLESGLWFVKAARRNFSTQDCCDLEAEWSRYKAEAGKPHPSADEALDWITGTWVEAHPDMDLPWLRDEAFSQISLIEEPDDPLVEAGRQGDTLIGRRITILSMKGEPTYGGKTGVVTLVDDIGQLHGTWGGCAVIPGEDRFIVESGDGQGALRAPSTSGDASVKAPYEDYRETEVFGEKANKGLLELVDEYRTRNHVDLVMSEWISAIDDAEGWDLDEAESEPEGLFELIMTLEGMYRDYGSGKRDRHDFAYQVSELMSTGKTVDEIRKDPKDLYIRLGMMY